MSSNINNSGGANVVGGPTAIVNNTNKTN
jgi:hypothetical protein